MMDSGGGTQRNLGAGTQWRVFVSSTSKDLQAEREAIERALHQMRDAEFSGMEYFGSRPDKPKAVCLQEVSQGNVYIGIFAHRYGYIDPESGLSMTELEYRQARRTGIPCLIYLKDESVPIPDEYIETDPESKAKLEGLKQELRQEHVVTFFKNPDQLATRVVIDLHNLVKENRLPEPIREITPTELRLILTLQFDLEELRTLCFELGVDFDDLRGEGKAAKARELVLYLQRRGQLNTLIAEIKKQRPDVNWS
jgi:hypothetical protein